MARPDVSVSMNKVGEAFDREAEVYDDRYLTKADLAEDDLVTRLLIRSGVSMSRVVDLGCGTGKLLDLIVVDDYTGLDVSGGMLRVARRKHPERTFLSDTMTNTLLIGSQADTVASLYGSPSYDSFPAIVREAHRLLKPGGRTFLMPYAHGRKKVLREPQAPDMARYVQKETAEATMRAQGFKDVQVKGCGIPWVHGNDRLPLQALKLLLETQGEHGNPDDAVFLVVTATKEK